jgi:hypothetical protein
VNGAVQQRNLTYKPLRMDESPVLEAGAFGASAEPPSGLGEPGLPLGRLRQKRWPMIFALTGTRLRSRYRYGFRQWRQHDCLYAQQTAHVVDIVFDTLFLVLRDAPEFDGQ